MEIPKIKNTTVLGFFFKFGIRCLNGKNFTNLGGLAATNCLEPLVSKDKKIFCIGQNKNSYRDHGIMTELYNFLGLIKIKYLLHLSNRKYIPQFYILQNYKKSLMEFNGTTKI